MAPALGNRRRQSLRDVFQDIMRRAAEWPADAVLIAGDLFEQERVSRDTVAFLREAFELIRPTPVFIAPGNHDPFVASSPYATEAWPANVFLFNRPEWTAHELHNEPLTVHGVAFDGPDISSNPFGALEASDDGRIHVAVAHGSEQAHQPPEKGSYAPFEAQAAATPGLHYLALGHFHAVTALDGDFDTCMFYAGAPEGHGFNETGIHHYLEIEILREDEESAPKVTVTPVPSSRAVYTIREVDCTEFTNSHQVVEAIRACADDPEHALLARVVLTGIAPPGFDEEISSVHDAVEGDFEFIDLVDETQPAEDFGALAKEGTSLGIFVHRINEEIQDAPDEDVRAMLLRAREVGVAAYRGRDLPVHGLREDGQ